MRPHNLKFHIFAVLSVLLAATLACNSLAAAPSTPAPTNTPPPTDTPTQIPTATKPPTSTPAPTNTAVPTRTATPVPQPGDVLLTDTFERAADNDWGTWRDAASVSEVLGGVLSLQVREQSVFYFSYAAGRFADVDMTFTAALESGAASNTMIGGQCRVKDDSNFYLFAISGTGNYTIAKYVEDDYVSLVDWTASNAIHTGKSANTLRIICAGEVLQFWVNGVRLVTVQDDEFERGKVGLVAGTFDEAKPNSKVNFDDLTVVLPDTAALALGETDGTGTSSGGGSTPQPTVAAVATQPPAANGQGTLHVTNNVSFGVLIVVWGPGDFKVDAPPNQTYSVPLPTGTYGWQVFANGCQLTPTQNLFLNPDAWVSIETYDNECGYQVYSSGS